VDLQKKTERGIKGYEQWEEGFESRCVDELLSSVHNTTRGGLSDALGEVGEESRTRILGWFAEIQGQTRSSAKWRHAWACIVILNALHIILPVH